MSGGAFEYKQYDIQYIHDCIEQQIINNDSTENDEWGNPISHGYSPETIEEFQNALYYLNRAAIYAQRIDWLLSGDDGEDSFHSRLKQELSELKDTK